MQVPLIYWTLRADAKVDNGANLAIPRDSSPVAAAAYSMADAMLKARQP
jgi:hypothetical protein